jgi:nucleoside-diphosphate-sugar epimerase
LAKRLLDRGDEVYGADNLNNYYDVRLKHARLAQLEGRPGFTFQKLDLADRSAVPELFQRVRPQRVVHLAAQARVRYIDDIVKGVIRVSDRGAAPNPVWSGERPDPGTSKAPYKLYNIGNNNPVELMHFIEVIEQCLGKTAQKRLLPMQPGDVPATYADVDDLMRDVGFRPATPVQEGVRRFVAWYRDYYMSDSVS